MVNLLNVEPTKVNIGFHDSIVDEGCQPVMSVNADAPNSIEMWPSDRTFNSGPGSMILANKTYTYDHPNISFAGMNLGFRMEMMQNPFGFNHLLMFNNGVTITNDPSGTTTTFGPGQTFISQPTFEADTNNISMNLNRDFLSQPKFQTVNGGLLDVVAWSQMQLFGIVDSGATIQTRRAIQVGKVSGAGAITNEYGIEIDDLDKGTNIAGIRSLMNGSTKAFIDHTGNSPSNFGGKIAVGPISAVGDNNWFMIVAPPHNRSTALGGEYADVLLTTSGNLQVAHPISTLAGTKINEPGIQIVAGGSVTNACTLQVATAPTEGTNNYAILCDVGQSLFNDLHVNGNLTMAVQSPAYTTIGTSTDRSLDAVDSLSAVIDVLGTLISDLKNTGIIG